MTLLVFSQMIDGAPMLLPADELCKKFEQTRVNSVSSHGSSLKLIVYYGLCYARKQEKFQCVQYRKQNYILT